MPDDRQDKLKALVEMMSAEPDVSDDELAELRAALPWADGSSLKWLALELRHAAHRATTAFEGKFIPQKKALTWADATHLEKEFRKALNVAIAEVVKWIEAEVREEELIPFEERWDLKRDAESGAGEGISGDD